MATEQICNRCGRATANLYPHTFWDDFGEKRKMNLCWDCDFDVINGGEYIVDEGELALEREEQDYLDDPINNPKPQ